ncbi:MAG: ABC transporter ATP-binding protein [Thermoprotei archaeon]|nr:MAG: ABC transporter ATP-binding protein [Thermoprotei archaeon]
MIIDLEDVNYWYPSSSDPVLKNIHLKADRGEIILLTGPSGCGKSTLARILNGLIPNFYGGRLEGKISIIGMDPRETPTYKLAKHVGFVFQNPENQLFFSTVEKELAFGLENLGISPEIIMEKIEKILKEYGIEDLRNRSPSELSGGQQQKVAIASVMIMNPEIIVLDEPTANLDPVSAIKILGLVKRKTLEKNTLTIIIEHRIEIVLPFITRLIVMKDGEIVADGDPIETIITYRHIIGIPPILRLYERLEENGIKIPKKPKTPEELALMIYRYLQKHQISLGK